MLLINSLVFIGFDSTGRPLFEVATPPNLLPNSRSSLPIDHVDSNGVPLNLPQPTPVDQRLLPPFSSPSQALPSSTPQTASSRDSRQSIGTDGALHPALPPQVQKLAPPASSPVKTPQPPAAIGILPNARIRVEGFQPIDRRFATRKKRFIKENWTSESVDHVQEEQSDQNEFLPVVSSPRRLSDVESFDQNDSEVDDFASEGSGGSQSVSLIKSIVFPSSTSLHPESGYQEAATQIEQGISKSRLNSEIIFRIEQEEEERNSISDTIEGSALEEDVKVTEGAEENVVSSDSFFGWLFGVPRNRPAKEDSGDEDVEIDMQENLEKDGNLIVQEKNTSRPTVDQPVVSTPASVSPNSVPCK